MAVPGPKAKAKQRQSLNGWQAIVAFFGSANIGGSTMGEIRDASHPRGSAGAGFAAEELNCWLGREVSEPVRIATESADLASELKRGLSFVRKHTHARKKKRTA
jgi:hypothetical protein